MEESDGSTIAFSSDGKTLAEATMANTIRLWQVDAGKEFVPVGSGHHGTVKQLAVSADGKVLTTFAAARAHQTIRQWDMASGKELRQINLPAPAMHVALSGDGQWTAFNTGVKIHLWDVAQGKEIRALDMGPYSVPAVSAHGKLLALRGTDPVLHVFDTATVKEHRRLEESEQPAPNLDGFPGGGFVVMAFSSDGAALAAVNSNRPRRAPSFGGAGLMAGNELRLWNLARGKRPRLFETQEKWILDLAVTPDGRHVVTANADDSMSVWEALTGKECMTIKLKAPLAQAGPQQPAMPGMGMPALAMPPMVWGGVMPRTPSIKTLAISPDGRTLAAAWGQGIHLWDLRTGKELGQFKGHQGTVVSVAFAPDNQTIVSGSADTTALVWDAGKGIKKTPTIELKAHEIDDMWQDLAGEPTRAYQAMATLSAAPEQAAALVREKIKPAAGVAGQRIEKWIADLESDQFQTRQRATRELEKLGELAEPALQKAMPNLKSLEHKRRVEKLLASIVNDQVPSAEVLRALRAVQVLEQIGTPEARTELERLAKGAPGDKLTRSAESTLKRLLAR
jgi:WD40 repeat protein